jgi:uncharacterized membrane protein
MIINLAAENSLAQQLFCIIFNTAIISVILPQNYGRHMVHRDSGRESGGLAS